MHKCFILINSLLNFSYLKIIIVECLFLISPLTRYMQNRTGYCTKFFKTTCIVPAKKLILFVNFYL